MREILFKAKGQTSGRWYEGLLTRIDKDVCWIKDEYHDEWICDSFTLCQYTGLTDKSGKKIWENDIVAFIDMTSSESGYWERDCCGQVLWDEGEACFHVTNRLSAESYEVLQGCSVIGNVFENPEIFEQEGYL